MLRSTYHGFGLAGGNAVRSNQTFDSAASIELPKYSLCRSGVESRISSCQVCEAVCEVYMRRMLAISECVVSFGSERRMSSISSGMLKTSVATSIVIDGRWSCWLASRDAYRYDSSTLRRSYLQGPLKTRSKSYSRRRSYLPKLLFPERLEIEMRLLYSALSIALARGYKITASALSLEH